MSVKNGWEVAYTTTFQVGLHARLVESAVKRLWFEERKWMDGSGRGETWSDGYTETVLLHDPEREEPWRAVTPLALWMDVLVQIEKLGFAADERRAEAEVS